jgi:Fe-S-cluster containining protein
MESIIFIALPISLLLVLGLGILAFFDAVIARPSGAAPAGFAQRDLPLLSGNALRQWASSKARRVVAKYSKSPHKASTASALAIEIESLTDDIIAASVPWTLRGSLPHCDRSSRDTISVSVPETLAIVESLRARLSQRELKKIRNRAQKNAEWLAVKEQSDNSLIATVCPLLSHDGCCISYESRPVFCRGHCTNCVGNNCGPAAAIEQPEVAFAAAVGQGITDGLTEGLTAAGLDGQRYELNRALVGVLDVPNAAARWARGEAVLESCGALHAGASS